MALTDDLLGAFETHSASEIRAVLAQGIDVNEPIRGKRPIDWLIEMYLRSEMFEECIRAMLDAGAVIGDPLLEAILLDDARALRAVLAASPGSLHRVMRLECAFTSLHGVSPLHVCAEYNATRCAAALIEAGIDVNIRAEVDSQGLGGHTPLFHTVNSILDYCRPMLELLLDAGASTDVAVRGVIWGEGFEWETVVFDVTPISYAQCGLYAQFHRHEPDIYRNIDLLYSRRYGATAPVRNVPNRYLSRSNH